MVANKLLTKRFIYATCTKFSEEQRKKEKEMREKKLLDEKLEKQREKELKEQQRKTERDEKGMYAKLDNGFSFVLTNISVYDLFRGTTQT